MSRREKELASFAPEDLLARLRTATSEHPYQAVGIALAAGYVIGGGLLTKSTFRLLGLGLRFAAVPLLQRKLGAVLGNSQFTSNA